MYDGIVCPKIAGVGKVYLYTAKSSFPNPHLPFITEAHCNQYSCY